MSKVDSKETKVGGVVVIDLKKPDPTWKESKYEIINLEPKTPQGKPPRKPRVSKKPYTSKKRQSKREPLPSVPSFEQSLSSFSCPDVNKNLFSSSSSSTSTSSTSSSTSSTSDPAPIGQVDGVETKEEKSGFWNNLTTNMPNPLKAGFNTAKLRDMMSLPEPNDLTPKQKLKFQMMRSGKSEREIEQVDYMNEGEIEKMYEKLNLNEISQVADSLALAVTTGLGAATDILFKGEGHIKKEFEDDNTLKKIVSDSISKWHTYLNGLVRAAALSGTNIYKGTIKRNKRKVFAPQNDNIQYPRSQVQGNMGGRYPGPEVRPPSNPGPATTPNNDQGIEGLPIADI